MNWDWTSIIKYILGMLYSKRNWLCKIGFHKFQTVTIRSGYIDCGDEIMCFEQTYDKCTREDCSISRNHKKSYWITFKKETEKKE